MTEEELNKIIKEYQESMRELEETRRAFNEKYENMSEEELVDAMAKDLQEVLEDAEKNGVNVIKVGTDDKK